MPHKIFNYTSADNLLQDAGQLGLTIPYSDDNKVLGSPVKIGNRLVPNRLLAQPIEGFDACPDGAPSEKNIKRYRRYAAGMSGMIWIESVSVNERGRSNPSQLWITKDNIPAFRRLQEGIVDAAVDWGRPYTVLQLTHSGRYSGQHSAYPPESVVHNPYIPRENEYILSDDELEALEEDYVTAALLAEEAGFDAVDIRACHGYLINELLGARTRPGRYGGSFENRCCFLLRIIDKIHARSHIQVAVRLNVFDGVPYPYGFGVSEQDEGLPDMEEPLKLVRMLDEHGVRLINISAGIGAYSPQIIRPSDSGGEIYRKEHPLEGIARMLRLTALVKQAAPHAVVAASAFTWLREFAVGVAAGGINEGIFDIAGFGRQALCYPAYAKDILQLNGLRREQCCSTCNGCMAWIKKTGKAVRCVIKEKEDGGLR